MKKHIAALDPLVLAMVHARRGNTVKAAQLFAQAVTAPDAVLAIQTLEHNNQKAFEVEASARAEAAKVSAKKVVVKKVVANEFDIEGEDPVVEEDVIEAAEGEGDEEEAEDEDDGTDVNIDINEDEDTDDDAGDDGDATFEATLASFLKKGTRGKSGK